MCSHLWKRVGECFVCIKCGITRLPNGRIFFDRKLPNFDTAKEKRMGKT